MHLSGYDLVEWAVGFAAQLILVAVLFVRRRYLQFPVFTGLIAFECVKHLVLFLVWVTVHHRTVHYYAYANTRLGIVDEVIQLFVFYELASKVFCPTGRWAEDVRRGFRWLIAASAAVAVLLAWLAAPPVNYSIQSFVLRSDFLSAALMSELFIGTLWLSSTAGLPWKTHAARIAQGIGFYSLTCLVLGAVVNYLGFQQGTTVFTAAGEVRSYVWIAALGYWIVTLWQEAPAPRELPDTMLIQIYKLQRLVENDLVRIRNWRQP